LSNAKITPGWMRSLRRLSEQCKLDHRNTFRRNAHSAVEEGVMGIRKDVAKLGAREPGAGMVCEAIKRLQPLGAFVRTSWRYLGAIHGFNRQTWLNDRVIRSHPSPKRT
jgi:hypothetical protein